MTQTTRRATLAFAAACLFAVLPSAKGQATDHWSLRAPRRSDVPAVRDATWVRNSIDAFVLARLEKANLSPSPEADRRTLIRRASFDLTGLPPTPEEVAAFVSDPSPDAYEKLVDRLLASPRYGERWARHWLDVVRFADTHGFEMNQPRPNAWRYRDWLIRALNDDKPYDRFVLEQLAGDSLRPESGADEATGFLVAGPWDQVKSPDPVLTAQQRADELHDIVSVTSATFLGLTVGCARCHDHKFDPIPQADYFRFVAIFAGVQHGERPLRAPGDPARAKQAEEVRHLLAEIDTRLDDLQPLADPAGRNRRPPVSPLRNVERFEPVDAKHIRFSVAGTNQFEPCIDELEIYAGADPHNLALTATPSSSGNYPGNPIHRLEHVNDGRYGNGRSWICDKATGWVALELAEKTRIDRIVWGRDREGKYQDRLATSYRIEVSEDGAAWRPVASSDDRIPRDAKEQPASLSAEAKQLAEQQKKLQDKLNVLTAHSAAYAGMFTKPGPTHRLNRGDPMQPLEVVAPGALTRVGPALDLPPDATEQQRRLALAKWIIDPSNPLTARVIVNRLWQHHFGRGLVDTPSDFGRMGAAPTHPELLDWHATELVANGWRLKPIHRLIVLSSTYRQSGAMNPSAASVDADTRLLWRYPPRRLEAEAIRDAILAVSGKLDLTPGGPGFDTFKPNDNYVRVYDPKDQFGPNEWRRMVYQFKPRSQHDGTFGAFDCPDAGQAAPRRTTSTTPLQALNLMNGPFVVQQAEFFAEHVSREAPGNPAKQVDLAFALAFGRAPDESERAASVQLARDHGLPALCRALFNANEFVYVN